MRTLEDLLAEQILDRVEELIGRTILLDGILVRPACDDSDLLPAKADHQLNSLT